MNARETFKHNLKVLRKRNCKTAKATAELLSVKQTTYKSWEYGTAEPKIGTLSEICKLYEVTMNDMLTIQMN